MVPVFDDWRSVTPDWTGGVVALGNFDGVHRGHQALLAQAHEQAAALGTPVIAFTFEPHPAASSCPTRDRSGSRWRGPRRGCSPNTV